MSSSDKVEINGSPESKVIIDEIVEYVISESNYTHEKYITSVNPETGETKEEVLSITFDRTIRSLRNGLRSMLEKSQIVINRDLYGEMKDDMCEVFQRNDLLNNIKKSFLKAFVQADYAVGLEASFSIGSNATQVTLNSFHSSGALKKTEDAIGSIVSIAKGTSKPEKSSTHIVFNYDQRPSNYYDILNNYRKDFTEATFDYFVQDEQIISVRDLLEENDGKPDWYNFYENVYDVDIANKILTSREIIENDTEKLWKKESDYSVSVKLMKYTLSTDNMYSFRVTSGEIAQKLEEKNQGKFLFIYSPLLQEEVEVKEILMEEDNESVLTSQKKMVSRCYLHVYLLLDQVQNIPFDVAKIEETILETDALGTFNPVLMRGIRGIREIAPESVTIHSFISSVNEIYDTGDGKYYSMYFNPTKLKIYGILDLDISDLLKAIDFVDVTPLNKDTEPILDEKNNFFFISNGENPYELTVTLFSKDGDPKDILMSKITSEKLLHEENINTQLAKRNKLYMEGKHQEAYQVNVFPPNKGILKINEINFILALGTNIREVWKIPNVDPYQTYSTYLGEIQQELGIEAVRNVLGMEFHAASGYGGYIDPRHVLLSVDRMTHPPSLRGFRKESYQSENYSALTKALLESPSLALARASGLGEAKQILSPIESVMVGGSPNFGTTSKSTQIDFDENFSQIIKKKTIERKKFEVKDLRKNVIQSNLQENIINAVQQVVQTDTGFETVSGGYIQEPIRLKEQLSEQETLLRKNITPWFSTYNQTLSQSFQNILNKKEEKEDEDDEDVEVQYSSFAEFYQENPNQVIGEDEPTTKKMKYKEVEIIPDEIEIKGVDLDDVLSQF